MSEISKIADWVERLRSWHKEELKILTKWPKGDDLRYIEKWSRLLSEIEQQMKSMCEELGPELVRAGESTLSLRQIAHCVLMKRDFDAARKIVDNILPHLEALCDRLRYDEGKEPEAHKRQPMSAREANAKALELADKDKEFVKRSQREWAEAIGCSDGLVSKLPLWQKTMQLSGRRRKGRGTSKAVSFTKALENTIGEQDDPLQGLIAEQEADYEPSPLEEDTPFSRPKRVRCYKIP